MNNKYDTFSFTVVPQDCLVDFDNFGECYDDQNLNRISRSLLLLSIDLFRNTYLIMKVNKLKKKIGRLCLNENPKDVKVHKFILNHMSDAISICTCFENFFKYKLLKSGYLVHQLNKHKIYNNLNLNEPLRVSEIQEINFDFNKSKTNNFLKMREHTYSLSHLLKEENKFTEIFNVDDGIVLFLRELNNFRNMLHFYSSVTVNYSLGRLEILDDMNTLLQNSLQQEMESK